MGDVAYVSEVRVEREGGPVRRGYLPAEDEPVMYGAHGAVRDHYGYPEGSTPTTRRRWTMWWALPPVE